MRWLDDIKARLAMLETEIEVQKMLRRSELLGESRAAFESRMRFRGEPRNEECGGCKFYLRSSIATHGGCRRRAPSGARDLPSFPVVAASNWCGEYRPAGSVSRIVGKDCT